MLRWRDIALAYLLFCAIALTVNHARAASHGGGATTTTYQPYRQGAGGFIRGIDIQCDQGLGKCPGNGTGTTTKVIRTDTYNAYIWSQTATTPVGNAGGPGAWLPLFTASSLPPGDPMLAFGACLNNPCDVYEARIAPSNTSVIYAQYGGYLYRSADKGAHWWNTNYPQDTASSVDQYGPKGAIDPVNPNIVIWCTTSNGCSKTIDGGVTWTVITGITNATTIGMFPEFVVPVTVTGGATQDIYLGSYGTGVYYSSDGGVSFTLLNSSGMPTQMTHMRMTSTGVPYVVPPAGGTSIFYGYVSSAWVAYTASGTNGNMVDLAVDPATDNDLTVINAGGGTAYTSSGPTTGWSSFANPSRAATDIPWLAVTNESFMTAGQIVYDMAQSHVLYFSEGIGVWTVTPSSASTVVWTSQSAGIEQLVTSRVINSPTGAEDIASWDRCVMHPQIGTYPATNPAPEPNPGNLQSGWSIDWASQAPSVVAVICAGVNDYLDNFSSGISTDNGNNFTPFSAQPGGVTMTASITNYTPQTSSPVTISIASPAIITWNSNGLFNGQPITFSTTGALPTGLSAGTTYYVLAAATNTFELSTTQVGGTAINTSGTQSGTQTASTTPTATLNVSAVQSGTILAGPAASGMLLLTSMVGSYSTPGWYIYTYGTGGTSGTGGVGTYKIWNGNQNYSSQTMYALNYGYFGGCIAAQSATSIISITGNGASPANGTAFAVQYTADGGVTWHPPDSSLNTVQGFSTEYYNWSRNCLADRVNTNFYVYSFNTGSGDAFFKSSNGGLTWTQQCSACDSDSPTNSLTGFFSYHGVFEATPGSANEIFATGGGGSGASNPNTNPMYHSTDAGQHFHRVSNVEDVFALGFGAPKPGGSGAASLYIVGYVNQGSGYVAGVWRSDDDAVTWNFAGAWPGSLDTVTSIDGNKIYWGTFRTGFSGSGAASGQLNYLLRRDVDPASNDNSPEFLSRAA
jgi:hypothetical protein